MSENIKKRLVQRIVRNLLDIQILRLVKNEPMWGYKIKQHVESNFAVTLRHGALYPLLNQMEKDGYLISQREPKGGRIRKTYRITPKGLQLIDSYREVMREQINETR